MEIKRILVSRTDKIGDLLLSIPSFYMLKKMYPEAELEELKEKIEKVYKELIKDIKGE